MGKIYEIRNKLVNTIRKLIGIPGIIAKLTSIEKNTQNHTNSSIKPQTPHLSGTTANVRKFVADTFIKGNGIEIGAFAYPLSVPNDATVKYIDKYDEKTLDTSHKIAGLTLQDFGIDPASIIKPDIIDDGECLGKIGDYSQDFVIANHVLEHFEDPIKGFKNILRVLKHDGIIYLSLPEMRHSFDSVRQPTPFEHLLRDYNEGPAWSRSTAYAEFSKIFAAHGMDKGLFPKKSNKELIDFEEKIAKELDTVNFSIHFHAWTMDGMIEMFAKIKSTFNIAFETRLIIKNNEEVIFIFQKTVPHIKPQ